MKKMLLCELFLVFIKILAVLNYRAGKQLKNHFRCCHVSLLRKNQLILQDKNILEFT